MNTSATDLYNSIFSTCRRTLGSNTWGRVLAAMDEDDPLESFPDTLAALTADLNLPAHVADLARLEWTLYQKQGLPNGIGQPVDIASANPSLTLLPVGWKHLPDLIEPADSQTTPLCEPAHIMIWQQPRSGEWRCRDAEDIDLLALKLIVEQIDPRQAATQGKVSVSAIQTAIERAITQGLILSPESRIRRRPISGEMPGPALQTFVTAEVFTLQWHITQTCDLHCRHCYDRSDRTSLSAEQAMTIVEDFYAFCRRMHVRGQITFTGGNPLLYPHFKRVYQAASQAGFGIAILGNPGPREPIEALLNIAHPHYFQISLEGLEAHNDHIRGQGHFQRSLAFLDDLRALNVFSMVMLTLTRNNLDQVLPLADRLRDRADFFTFNRLATVGEGASLMMPDIHEFRAFLRKYAQAAARNPIMGLKENLFNLIKQETGDPLFGGCTGFGCGAAFNFLALLPDGEVHACRKFPSLVGNIHRSGLYDIYHSERAARYRTGSRACADCSLNPVCRGCLAITHSLGLDVFNDKDPFCFAATKQGQA